MALPVVGCAAALAQVPADRFDYSRASSFTYRTNGLLESEKVEPDVANANLCVVTTYDYDDAYGNKTASTTANCAGASGDAVFTTRTSGSAYAAHTVALGGVTVTVPEGAFATTVTNALNQSEQRRYDPRFGTAISLTGPNGLTTSIQLDDFGRAVKELRADGTSTVTDHCIIAGRGLDTSSNTGGCGSTVRCRASAPRFRPTR